MADIFQEVEEDLRAEKMRRLALRYGGAVVGVLVLIVAGAGAWQGWRTWQGNQDAQYAEGYVRAVEAAQRQRGATGATELNQAIAELDKIAQTSASGYRTLASLNAAALQADKSSGSDALSTWDRVAGDAQAHPELRQLATLMWAAHQLDSGSPDQIRHHLEALITGASPWTPMARELLAVLDIREAKPDAAQNELKRLTAGSLVPSGLSGRAASLLASFGG